MEADYTIELGHEDPVLDFPWTDPAGKLAYFDLKRQPELLGKIAEAKAFPELAEFLKSVNSPRSVLESAKCDAWTATELSPEEEIFNASHKFASYVDLVFSDIERRRSLARQEQFVRSLVDLLKRAPEMPAVVEICVRRCFFGESVNTVEGFYCTLYASGYGEDEAGARKCWGIAMNLIANAIVQLSAQSKFPPGAIP